MMEKQLSMAPERHREDGLELHNDGDGEEGTHPGVRLMYSANKGNLDGSMLLSSLYIFFLSLFYNNPSIFADKIIHASPYSVDLAELAKYNLSSTRLLLRIFFVNPNNKVSLYYSDIDAFLYDDSSCNVATTHLTLFP
ncbi:hypothetical protein PIB30_061080 [Stylosanthes scabra]|uniref:Uncharacterized protein n=1 Tax=Stylosanthes scabra TaxID=79078 RepID=A0ABU6RKN2_9FABA|nr:hypothetical protein [Stylosanthes scabra]